MDTHSSNEIILSSITSSDECWNAYTMAANIACLTQVLW